MPCPKKQTERLILNQSATSAPASLLASSCGGDPSECIPEGRKEQQSAPWPGTPAWVDGRSLQWPANLCQRCYRCSSARTSQLPPAVLLTSSLATLAVKFSTKGTGEKKKEEADSNNSLAPLPPAPPPLSSGLLSPPLLHCLGGGRFHPTHPRQPPPPTPTPVVS